MCLHKITCQNSAWSTYPLCCGSCGWYNERINTSRCFTDSVPMLCRLPRDFFFSFGGPPSPVLSRDLRFFFSLFFCNSINIVVNFLLNPSVELTLSCLLSPRDDLILCCVVGLSVVLGVRSVLGGTSFLIMISSFDFSSSFSVELSCPVTNNIIQTSLQSD